jgi:hypothetical protein
MPSRLILSVQNYLTIRGFKPGPLDGEIGDQTVASWNRFLDSEEERLNPLEAPEDNAPPARTTPSIPTPSGSNSQTSVTGRATIFGLNYDGSMDAGDHGIGAWGTHTANKELIGVSLPEGVIVSTFGFEGTWRQDAAKVGRFLTEKKIQVEVFRNGKTILATVCDAGPARTYKGKLLHNAIDLTYALAHELDTSGDATVTYRILKDGSPMEIKGWDFANNCEIAQAGIA